MNTNVTGISILQLFDYLGVASAGVTKVDISAGQSGALYPAAGDLNSGDDTPFAGGVTPMLSVDAGDIAFYVNCRPIQSAVPGAINNGLQGYASGGNLQITVELKGQLLRPMITGPKTTPAQRQVSFVGTGAPPGSRWSWNFGDSPNPDPTQRTSTATHTFSTPSGASGYAVRATVTGTDGSSGLSPPFPVVVGQPSAASTPTTPSPKPTKTPTQLSNGNGAPTNSSQGPRDGNGSRAGGVPTNRGGSGAPGNSYDPRPSGLAATATASDGALQANGEVVGYVLSDQTRVAVQAQQGARKPRDDSASAARDGVESIRLSGWIVAVVAVVALLAVGAGSERRRPTFTRARRKQ